jgi:hypothetical protein
MKKEEILNEDAEAIFAAFFSALDRYAFSVVQESVPPPKSEPDGFVTDDQMGWNFCRERTLGNASELTNQPSSPA